MLLGLRCTNINMQAYVHDGNVLLSAFKSRRNCDPEHPLAGDSKGSSLAFAFIITVLK
jgi:hypothetical protein